MNNSLTVVRQIQFDKTFVAEVKRLGSLASPGSHVTFDGNEDGLTVTFHGKEVQARKKFSPCDVPFSFTMGGKELLGLLSTFSKSDLTTMTVKETCISFRAGHTKMNRGILADAPSPVFPEFSEHSLVKLPQDTFAAAYCVAYATAKSAEDDTSERVSILLKENMVSIIATNGQMAACAEMGVSYSGPEAEYLLHPHIINLIAPLSIQEEAPFIEMGNDGRKYLIRFGEYEVAVAIPLTPSRRGSVESAKQISKLPSLTASIQASALSLFLERAKLLDSGVSLIQPVVLKASKDNQAVYTRHTSTHGDIQDILDAKVEGTLPSTVIGMSLKNLCELCAHTSSSTITLNIYGALKPVVVTETIDRAKITHILLPVRTPTLEADSTDSQSTENAADSDSLPSAISPNDFDKE